jgi:hypothetical protein
MTSSINTMGVAPVKLTGIAGGKYQRDKRLFNARFGMGLFHCLTKRCTLS